MQAIFDIINALKSDIESGTSWVRYWVLYMEYLFLPTALFAFIRREARWILAALLMNVVLMVTLYSNFGYVRLLGLPHVICWTPLVIILWRNRDDWRVRETLIGKWLLLTFITIIISLAFDYSDVIRYMLGERGEM